MQHSLLIVSGQEQLEALVRRSLPDRKEIMVELRKTGSKARQALLERFFDLVLINAPLPDETGVELALDTVEDSNAGILILTPSDHAAEVMDRVSDRGILVMGKPLPHGGLGRALRLLTALQDKLHSALEKVEKAEERLEEFKLVTRAKLLLMEHKSMTEAEAHKSILKQAMDSGLSRRRLAESIIDELE
ncbi:MAG: ANTAR domain-containing protein [Lachnospiraceae bacterium]|nr:ANTAR domain-containing protein [Lachnospiraceae bacterium]